MGIQINGQTDTVTSTTAGGSVTVTPLAASSGLNVGTGASISSPATNVLTLGTNNLERVRIGSTGSVGIGTTNPASTVAASIKATTSNFAIDILGRDADNSSQIRFVNNTQSAVLGSLRHDGTNLTIGNTLNSPLIFNTNNTEVARITGVGSFGIGQSAPDERLHVTGASSGNTTVKVQSTAFSAERSSIEFFNNAVSRGRVGGSNDFDGLTIDSSSTESSAVIRFRTGGGTLTEKARIDSSGRLGVGTVNPTGNGDQTTIHVHAADYPVLHLTNSTTGTAASDGSELTLNADGSLILRNRENSFIRFDTNGSERLRIDSSGRVTTPYQPAFRAVDNSVNITLTAGSPAVFPNTSVSGGFNTGGYYSTSTGRFTAPVAGVYYFQACLGTSGWSSGNTTQDHFTLRVNNNAYVYSIKRENADTANTANGYFTDYGTFTVYLNANDYVTVVPTYTKNSFGNPGYTWFEGFLLG